MVYLVKDGIVNVGYKKGPNNKQIKNTNFYLISYDLKSNCGYIEKKGENNWRLYTTIGQQFNKSRYHHFDAFDDCVNKLKELKGNDDIIICDSNDVENYKNKLKT